MLVPAVYLLDTSKSYADRFRYAKERSKLEKKLNCLIQAYKYRNILLWGINKEGLLEDFGILPPKNQTKNKLVEGGNT